MNQIDVLGIRLTEGNAKDTVKEAWKLLGNGAMSIILYVSSHALLDAGEESEQKALLESAAMVVFGETGVLPLQVENYRERKKEIEQNLFLQEFLKRASRNHLRVCVVSDTQEKLELLRSRLCEIRDNLQISCQLVTNTAEKEDVLELVNELNDAAPDIVISRLPYAYLAGMLNENRSYMNAGIWLALLPEDDGKRRRGNVFSRFSRWFYKRLFRRKMNQYQEEQ